MQHRTIRKVSLPADAERVMEVFAVGKAIMVKSGNLNQWVNGYPSLEVVQLDIEKGGGFVVEDNGRIAASSISPTEMNDWRIKELSGRRGSNPRPAAWEAAALPTELLPHIKLKVEN